MLFVLETKGTTAVAAAGQEGFLDNQKLLDQITVLVYHLMGSLVLTYKDIGIGLEHFCCSVIKRSKKITDKRNCDTVRICHSHYSKS